VIAVAATPVEQDAMLVTQERYSERRRSRMNPDHPHERHDATPSTPSTPGIDATAVSAWLVEHVPDVLAPLDFELISGGRSNLTYLVRDATDRRIVLRRPPLGELLESAHDMGREHRIISALGSSSVPVPTALGCCEDRAVTGAPFYVMDYVDAMIVRDEHDAARLLGEPARGRLADSLIEVLASLHGLSPEAIGLGTLGRHDSYVERQLRRWQRQWEAVRSREIPAIEEARRLLEERRPEQQRVSIVHGDYRIDNVAVAGDGSVAAVLDWELCTLGDPLADVGLLLLNWVGPEEPSDHMLSGTPTKLAGFPDRASLLGDYARHSGADVSQIGFYVALAYWKLACIAEGIYVRYRSGAMGEVSERAIEDMAERVPKLAGLALETLAA
jgi:aminoglycoside phosphotransferase (APT) family kinase protein